MQLILSRKGVDSGAGRCASPIVNGEPISLPIPEHHPGRTTTTYRMIGKAELLERATGGRCTGDTLCHEDPMFGDGICAFGQVGPAQSHLASHGVGPGDVFLFFGLFSDEDGRNRHHRIFGYLQVAHVIPLGPEPDPGQSPQGLPRPHPHVMGDWTEAKNNTLYVGEGQRARHAHDALRLTGDAKQISVWNVPPWFKAAGLSYHTNPVRWLEDDQLRSVGRGQEFVAPVDTEEARAWVAQIIETIRH